MIKDEENVRQRLSGHKILICSQNGDGGGRGVTKYFLIEFGFMNNKI
jgi:hypothetical protein